MSTDDQAAKDALELGDEFPYDDTLYWSTRGARGDGKERRRTTSELQSGL